MGVFGTEGADVFIEVTEADGGKVHVAAWHVVFVRRAYDKQIVAAGAHAELRLSSGFLWVRESVAEVMRLLGGAAPAPAVAPAGEGVAASHGDVPQMKSADA